MRIYGKRVAFVGVSWGAAYKIWPQTEGTEMPDIERGSMGEDVIALAADHAGVDLKDVLKHELVSQGYKVLDLGTNGPGSVDYPDYGDAMGQAIRDGKAARGILVCGTGIGISIAANRYKEVRAAVVHDETTARLGREHNDANVMAIGARMISEHVALLCLDQFLNTAFGGERHVGRVKKLSPQYEFNTATKDAAE